MTRGSYVAAGRDYERDTEYVTTRITRDGRDGYPVEPGRYRLIAARACPWASRAIIVRRLLGLESAISMGLCGPTHDERSWTFDLDPDGVDPVLGYERVQQAYLARFPDYSRGDHGAGHGRDRDQATGHQRPRADHPRPLHRVDRPTTGHGAPDLYPEPLATRSTRWRRWSTPTSMTASTSAVSPARSDSYERAYDRLFARLDWLSERLAGRRYLVGEHDHRGRRPAVHHAGPVRRRLSRPLQVQPAQAHRAAGAVGVRAGPVPDARLRRHGRLRADQAALLRRAHRPEPDPDRGRRARTSAAG